MNLLLPFSAVLLGYVAALILKVESRNRIKLLLAFSGAFLLSAVASEFLPEIYEEGDSSLGIYLIVGVFVQIILEFFSKGAEHGHVHIHRKMHDFPYALFISLCLHALLEGMPLQGDNSMLYGIAIHKIPIAFIFSSFLLTSDFGRGKTLMVILIFAVMSPLGSWLGVESSWIQAYMLPIKAIVAGIVLHVSTTLILEASEAHQFNLAKVLVMLLGAALAFLI
ncbi:ZIP family metal transporter [Nonlabens xiamenensis]|uniref:ZIP family metal transporter n=1 Tax=Nonlabens xiamenensis TaxID=2341043 RepID=UPI000F6121AD|nr:ZIP family metal transporter [Nonlabens xiamenensis]